MTGKGRIYKVSDPSRAGDPGGREVKTAARRGHGRPAGVDELAKLLAHPDMRVRQEAQFALAARGDERRSRL